MNYLSSELSVPFNYGAASFLQQLETFDSVSTRTLIYDKLIECSSIRGTNIWVLFSDLCDKDLNKVFWLCSNCPNDVLEYACSRQDYSGTALVAKYFIII